MQQETGQLAQNAAGRSGWWQSIGYNFGRLNARIASLKGLPAIGVLGTLLVAYFQYISSYEDKVRDLAKEDLSAATSVFADVSNSLSKAMTLQQILFFTYSDAHREKVEGDENSFSAKSARTTYESYNKVRTELRENMPVYSRRIEIFIDWPSDLRRDPASNLNLTHDPLNKPGNSKREADGDKESIDRDRIYLLGAYDFDCDNDKYMPKYNSLETLQKFSLKPPPELVKVDSTVGALNIDWHSAMHQLVAFHYCFERIHSAIEVARHWASQSATAPNAKIKFDEEKNLRKIRKKLDDQVHRFNAFVALTMRRIEEIRIKYRPAGFWCHVPGIRELSGLKASILDYFYNKPDRGCTPIRVTSNQSSPLT